MNNLGSLSEYAKHAKYIAQMTHCLLYTDSTILIIIVLNDIFEIGSFQTLTVNVEIFA